MNNRLFNVLMGLLGIWMLYEIIDSWFLIACLTGGVFTVLFANQYAGEKKEVPVIFGVVLILIAILSTSAIWIIMIIAVIFKVGQNQKLFNTVRGPLMKKEDGWREREFVAVKFSKNREETAKKIRRKWFGDDTYGREIYEWEDVNFSKIAGDTVIDLGNTILPKEHNIVLIRKGFGDTKLLVPDEVAVSLDLSVFLGKVKIGEEELDLKNETLKWRSSRYENSSRKIKLVTSVFFGEIEVVFI